MLTKLNKSFSRCRSVAAASVTTDRSKTGPMNRPVRTTGAVVAGLALAAGLGACSSDKDDTSSSASPSASSSSSTSKQTSASSKPSSSEAKSEEKKADGSSDGTAGVVPVVPDTGETPAYGPAPVEGESAPEDVVHSIQNTLAVMTNDDVSVQEYYRNVRDHTCQAMIDQHPNALSDDSINNMPSTGKLKDIPGGAGLPSFQGVSDVKVNGDTASATVRSTFNEETQSATMIFKNEGGTWKLCN